MGIDDPLTGEIIAAAIAVHRELGPGLFESVYETCLAYELSSRNVRFERRVPVPGAYRGVRLEVGYRADFVIDRSVLVELKAVPVLPAVESQVLTYLRLLG